MKTVSLEAHILVILCIKLKIKTKNQRNTVCEVVAQKYFQSFILLSLHRDDKSLNSPNHWWFFLFFTRLKILPVSDESCSF